MNNNTGQYKPFVFSQQTLVVGLGGTGLSVARYLKQKNCPFDLADNRSELADQDNIGCEFPDSELLLGDFNYKQFKQYPQIIVSPGISVRSEIFRALSDRESNKESDKGQLIIGDIELFAQVVDKPVIAITGSNGKSTVTTLVEKIASDCGIKTIAGGNLGIPALDLLATQSDLYILELSSFQLETTYSLKTLSAIVLNVSEDHMDRYNGLDDYRQVKTTIYNNTDWAVINKDEQQLLKLFKNKTQNESCPAAERCIYFGSEEPQTGEYGLQKIQDGDYLLKKGQETLLKASELRLKGVYNYLNVLAAIALLEPLSLDREKMLQAVREYAGLEHRCEWVAQINGVDFYNDSKGTNAGATIAAINGLEPEDDKSYAQRQLILIAGGIGKGADFTELGKVIKARVKYLLLMGQDAVQIEHAVLTVGMASERIIHVTSMQEAVQKAIELAKKGDTVLLSPACASFDMYANYGERGNDFKAIIYERAEIKPDNMADIQEGLRDVS